jgi:hypothetical protein
MRIGVAQVLRDGIPEDRRAAQSYFRHLLQGAKARRRHPLPGLLALLPA